MLETLISSKTRIKLLLKFFLNSQSNGYLRSLETEFGESSNAIRLELNKFEKAGMLKSATQGNKKVFSANKKHPLFDSIHGLMVKYVGLDQIIENISHALGNLKEVYLIGDYAQGRDSGIIDLLFIGESLNTNLLAHLTQKAEKQIKRKVRYVHFKDKQKLHTPLSEQAHLLLWQQ
jgi:hypothetical protein